MTNINSTYTDLILDRLNGELLDVFYVGRASGTPEKTPSKQISSVNIWDYPLTLKQLEDWTSCR